MRLRDSGGPVAASVLAGFAGAGILDAVVTVARAEPGGGAPGTLALLALGLYGVAGLAAGAAAGWLAGGVRGGITGGPGALVADEQRDRTTAAGILSGTLALLVLCAAAAAGQTALIGKMESQKLAAIASAGMVALAAPVAAALAIGALPAMRRLVGAFVSPPARLGRTGLVLVALAGAGLLGGAVALSRADWRVLDLGPLVALAAATVLGTAHASFWYRTAAGRRLRQRLPGRVLHAGAAAAMVAAAWFGARVPESSPAYTAAADGSLGLRGALKIARGLADGDGDGFAARWGGGDCDDRRPDTFPGGEDVPGDGIDQNCEGGDARAAVAATAGTPGSVAGGTGAGNAGGAGAGGGSAATTGTRGTGTFTGNILIVTIDALRADRLGVGGYGRPAGKSLTPTLDALAGRGAYFKRAWAQAPNTPRSFPAIVTSRYPSEIAWQKQSLNYSPILPSNETFFDHLARAGWKPIGIFSHFYFTADRGIGKGFAEWSNDGAGTISESNKDVAAPRIVPRVVDRLRRAAAAQERFVLWTHLFEPHSSYVAHAEHPTNQTGVAGLMEKYDYEIAFVDAWVAKLLAGLRDAGLAENTAVVVMADHGEAWGEHRHYFHGQDLFDEQIRVPLIITVPGMAPAAVDDRVALVDVAPTLLDLVGAPIPDAFRGRSLLPLVEGKPRPPRPVFAELLPATAWPHHAAMMVDGGMKLIHRISDRRYELYDLAADPLERKNLAADAAHAPALAALKAKLLDFEEHRR